MSRTTKKDIRYVEGWINETLRDYGYLVRIKVQWAYGQPRAYLYRTLDNEMEEEISPRLPTGEMYRWLSAYHKGLCLGFNRGRGI